MIDAGVAAMARGRHAGLWLGSVLVLMSLAADAATPVAVSYPVVSGTPGVTLIGAVAAALKQNPDIQLQRRAVEASRGALLSAGGAFDPQFSTSVSKSLQNTPLGLTSLYYPAYHQSKAQSTDYSVNLSKTLRNGTVITANAGVTTTQNTLYSVEGYPPESVSNVGLTIDFPLTRSGAQYAAANETSANFQYRASQDSLHDQVASTVLKAATAYWNYVQAARQLQVLKQAEQVNVHFVSDIRKLIAADERPAADINLVLADLANRKATRIAAQQSLLVARQNLGLVMGLRSADIDRLGEPLDPLPAPASRADTLMTTNRLLRDGLARRWDVKAGRARLQANQALMVAAGINTRNPLDLKVGVGYSGLQDGGNGMFSLVQNRATPNLSATLTYSWDVGNEVARGAYVRQSAAYEQAYISLRNLERTASTDMRGAIDAVRHAALAVEQSNTAVQFYQQTVHNDKKMLALGSSTILDVVTVQNQLVTAELNNIAQETNYAIAVAQLRYQTGRLISNSARSTTLSSKELVSIPDFASSR